MYIYIGDSGVYCTVFFITKSGRNKKLTAALKSIISG
jgi:hypothetical protein